VATIINLAEFFLISIGLGVGIFSFLADTKATGAGFLKVLSGICGGSLILALILHLTYGTAFDPLSKLYYLSIFSFALTYFFHRDKKSWFMWILFAVQNLSLLLLLLWMNNGNLPQFFFALTSIMMLGSVTYAMVMGHWYLVTPKLSENPLKYALYFAWVFLLIKMGWTIYGYLEAPDFFNQGTLDGGGYAFNWMMLTMRIGWGYVVLGIMSFFAYRLVAMRSIQSATGMLYAMTFFVFVSELISNYMFLEYGLQI
jgi:hypothetical protein